MLIDNHLSFRESVPMKSAHKQNICNSLMMTTAMLAMTTIGDAKGAEKYPLAEPPNQEIYFKIATLRTTSKSQTIWKNFIENYPELYNFLRRNLPNTTSFNDLKKIVFQELEQGEHSHIKGTLSTLSQLEWEVRYRKEIGKNPSDLLSSRIIQIRKELLALKNIREILMVKEGNLQSLEKTVGTYNRTLWRTEEYLEWHDLHEKEMRKDNYTFDAFVRWVEQQNNISGVKSSSKGVNKNEVRKYL